MLEPSDKQKESIPRAYSLKETFKRLDIGETAGRDWIVLYERLTAPLPRSSDRANAARLVSLEAIKSIRAARSILSQSGGGVTAEDAMRRVLGLEPLPVEQRPTQPELTPQAFAAAVRTELEPLLERLSSLEAEVKGLRQELTAPRALPNPVQVELDKIQSSRPNTFFNRLKNVFGRDEK